MNRRRSVEVWHAEREIRDVKEGAGMRVEVSRITKKRKKRSRRKDEVW